LDHTYFGELHVGGLFWSHTQYQAPGVSTRDTDTQGRLRNNYTYATSHHIGVTPIEANAPSDCFGPQCGFFFDADAALARRAAGGSDPTSRDAPPADSARVACGW